MTIDIITIHPRSMDYPIWRAQMAKYRGYYNKLIVAFEGAGEDYSPFVRQNLDAEFVDTFIGEGEWRDVAVNRALDKSTADWVWFLEQDFFWKDKEFVETLLEATKYYDAIGFWEANRLHPGCFLIDRKLVNSTLKDFSPDPDRLDHFGKFSEAVVGLEAKIGELDQLGFIGGKDWYHMQGLTHNYNLCRSGELSNVFKKDEFSTYNHIAPTVKVAQSPDFTNLSRTVNEQLKPYSKVSWLERFWKQYA